MLEYVGRALLASCISVTLAGAASAQPAREPTLAESLEIGRALVTRNCAMCHAVGRTGESPNRNAPALRRLSLRMDVESLGEGLAQGILTEHPAMPSFRFAPHEVVGIVRYLRSIQEKQSASLGPDPRSRHRAGG